VKCPLGGQNSKNFNVSKYNKFIDMVSDSMLQVTFKKLTLAEAGCCIKEYCDDPNELLEYLSFLTT
jgi:hypothetical protein